MSSTQDGAQQSGDSRETTMGTGGGVETAPITAYSTDALEDGSQAQVEGGSESLEDLMQVGIAAAQAGDKAGANVTFHRVVELYPEVPEAWIWLAGTTNDLDEAESAFQTAVKLDRTNQEAQLGLRWVALRKRVTGKLGSVSDGMGQLPHTSGNMSPADVAVQESGASRFLKVLKSPTFIFGLVLALSIVVIWFAVVRGGR